MSITPRGMSIQEAYRLYRDGKFAVNRRYQRKLVWSVDEKAALVQSILESYPIPLILLAAKSSNGSGGVAHLEIIDGMQRLNAVLSFIEQQFPSNNSYFDIAQFLTAKNAAGDKLFIPVADPSNDLLPPEACARFLDYQLAVTVYPSADQDQVTEIFRRINAQGRQLSNQERRQAGVTSNFADIVRQIASELRGDVSSEVLDLSQMPSISVDSQRERQAYGVRADDTIWCRQGILAAKQLRDSEDEQLIADICTSIITDIPFPYSKENLDEIYDQSSDEAKRINDALSTYGSDRLAEEIKGVFSVLKDTIEKHSDNPNCLRNTVRSQGAAPIKTPFYAIFMAFFDLLIVQRKSPDNQTKIMGALYEVDSRLDKASHHTTTELRERNVNIVTGLIQDYFIDQEPPIFKHGAGLAIDFENAIRRSRIETSRYELKQGLIRLDEKRDDDPDLYVRLGQTICGIANVGPRSSGDIFVGVADSENDANRIMDVDAIEARTVGNCSVVGVDREAVLRSQTVEEYVRAFSNKLSQLPLSNPLKTQVCGSIDTVSYHGFSVIRIHVPAQDQESYYDNRCYIRRGSETLEVKGPQIASIVRLFTEIAGR